MDNNCGKCKEYRDNMEKLFSEWKTAKQDDKDEKGTSGINHRDSVFVKDGVVCPEQWFSQDVRPLFLLKEAHGGSEDWDLTGYLRSDGSASNMWKRIAEWTYGLLSTKKNEIASYTVDPGHNKLGNYHLKQIAAVNVKKSDGQKESDMDTIRAYAEFDHDRLKKQIEYCDPTVIVCCATVSALDAILKKHIREPRNDNCYYFTDINGHSVMVLDYWHPANRYPAIMNYYGLMGIYNAALSFKVKGENDY